MRTARGIWFILGTLILAGAPLLSACSAPASPTATPIPTRQPLRVSPSAMPLATPRDWLIIDLPADAAQVEYGAEVYRLVCRDCHGDRGQGLTPEFRATWAPADQNCWQSKCHAPNHPPEGFLLPVAPPIVGATVMAKYRTAADLHSYIQADMPWYAPGSLTPRYSWSVTAFVLKMNQIDPGVELNQATASQILLR